MGNVKRDLFSRVAAWRTSSVGLTGTAVAVYLFTALGCRWPSSAEWLAVIIPGVLGLAMKDRRDPGSAA